MIGIIVDHDRIGIPKPIGDIGVIERSDAKVEPAEPEALAITALKMENMARSEATAEPAVFERTIEVESAISRSEVVSDPPAIVLDVRRSGMLGSIPEFALVASPLGTVRRYVPSGKTATAMFTFLTPFLGISGKDK
jgi:hypothetical protein